MSLPVREWDEFIYLLSVEPIAKLDYTEGEEKVVMGVLGKLKQALCYQYLIKARVKTAHTQPMNAGQGR